MMRLQRELAAQKKFEADLKNTERHRKTGGVVVVC